MKKNVFILLIVLFALVISTFLIDFHYADAYTLGELVKEIAKCAAIEGDLERLEAYDNLARLLGVAYPKVIHPDVKGTGKWIFEKKINPIDDTTTITFVLNSDSGESVYGKSISLVLRYRSEKTEAYIGWSSYLGSEANVLTRIGIEKASTQTWSLSTDSQGTFYPKDATKFIQKLMEIDSFVAQVTPYNENPITAVFDVRGLKNAVEQFNDILHWIKD
ncbi:MAG: hypothetical protein FP833_02210 [Atribacteria sp.]|nr:hypothetical protein [Candidatus Atribacteria bacterium]